MKPLLLVFSVTIIIFGVFWASMIGGEVSLAAALVFALIALALKLLRRPFGILIFFAVIIALAVILGVHFQNDLFEAFSYALTGLFYCLPVALVLGLVALGFKLAKQPIGKILSYSLLVSCSLVVSLIIFDATGSVINRWKIDAVESYVARAVPVLDQIKREKGAYPSELPTDILGRPPELLRLYGDYKVTGSDFRFEYDNDPAEWAGGEGPQMFDSSSRKWMEDR